MDKDHLGRGTQSFVKFVSTKDWNFPLAIQSCNYNNKSVPTRHHILTVLKAILLLLFQDHIPGADPNFSPLKTTAI